MPGIRRTREQKARDRAEIARLALFGNPTQQEIAEKVGLDQATVSRELKAIREEWQARAQADISEVIAKELRKLDEIEMRALAAYEASLKDSTTKTVSDGKAKGGGKTASITTQSEHGDPRFLKVILDCQERRAKLLGFDKPQKVAPTTPDGDELPQGPVIVALPAQLDAETWAQAFSKKPG